MKIFKYMTGPLQVNTYLAYDEETKKGFIVDPGGYDAAITKKVQQEGIEIEYIILTHGHGDHIGGVAGFQADLPGAKIVAHVDEVSMLTDSAINCSDNIFGKSVTVDADILVRDKEELPLGNTVLNFIHTPGHTPGGMCIYVDKVLFSGDTLFRRSIGRTDFPGGNFNEIVNSIRGKLYNFSDDTPVLPGHMGETTIGEEKRGNPFV